VVPRGSEAWHPGTEAPSLVDLMSMDAEAWDSFSRGSALRRAGRAGFLRNAAVALGNWGSLAAVPPLVSALSDPGSPDRGRFGGNAMGSGPSVVVIDQAHRRRQI
jgi:epoxyqueuosine reductase QueG